MDNNHNKLFILLKNNNYEEFKKLLQTIKPNKLNIKDNNNNYLITYAILKNNIEIVKLLLKKDCDTHVLDQEGRTILYIPIKYGYDELLKILVDNGKSKIINIKDSHNNIPLHYAILYKNMYAIKLLLDANTDTNITDNKGNTSLHLSIYSKSYDICNLIVNKGANINAITLIGESALHIACNYKLHNIIEMLLDNNIDTNIQDNESEFVALMYSISLHDIVAFKMLLKHGANPNIQDYLGNSSIHHVIMEDSDELLFELMDMKKQMLNFNEHNIYGKLPLHLLLEKNIKENDITKYIVNQSNLNYQDYNGNTPMHYICKKYLWKYLSNVLNQKKINVFMGNNNKVRPIDYISKHDIKQFFAIVVDSYNNILKKKNFVWSQEWENLCGKEIHYNKLDQHEKKIINNMPYKINKKEEICNQIITKKLYDIYECKTCTNCSYPLKKGGKCLKIPHNPNTETCLFVGISIDILVGLLYLLNKHSFACSTLTKNFIKNDELLTYIKVMGFETNTKYEFTNFEIVWTYKKIFFSENFVNNFKKCVNNKKVRFVIIPLGIEIQEGSHANYVIFDKNTFEVERFEPYGSNSPSNYDYNERMLDSILSFKFNEIYDNITYISPTKFLPKIGFQYVDVYEKKTKKLGDPGGFCAVWSIWYTDMRLTYPDYDRKKLVTKLLKEIRTESISFKNLIRDYSLNITHVRDKLFAEAHITINNWINEEYNDDQYRIIINGIIKMLNEHTL